MINLSFSTGDPVPLREGILKNYRGMRLPGSELLRAEREGYSIFIQSFNQRLYQLRLRSFDFKKETRLNTSETDKGLRLEAALTGVLEIREPNGEIITLRAGQYHITDRPIFQSYFPENTGCSYFTIYLPQELLAGMGAADKVISTMPKVMHSAMRELLYEMLGNPYDNHLRLIFYENNVRDLVFLHMATPPYAVPGELTEAEISAVHAADCIIETHLHTHFTIKALASRAHTNVDVLKRGFQQVFGTGVFGRLLSKRMEKAKYLLEHTNLSINAVGEHAGYETVGGFITSFRKRFKKTPKDWRKARRGGSSEV